MGNYGLWSVLCLREGTQGQLTCRATRTHSHIHAHHSHIHTHTQSHTHTHSRTHTHHPAHAHDLSGSDPATVTLTYLLPPYSRHTRQGVDAQPYTIITGPQDWKAADFKCVQRACMHVHTPHCTSVLACAMCVYDCVHARVRVRAE